MIRMDQFMDVKVLHQQGHSLREIARMANLSRNTVRTIVRREHPVETRPTRTKARPRSSKLEPFKEYIAQRYQEYRLSAVRLLPEITAMGYRGSVHTIRRYINSLAGQERRTAKATVRFETPPAKQAQCDWGHVGTYSVAQGKPLNVYVFVMVLSYSRQMFIHFTTSMKLPVLIRCHQLAFEFFQGIPQSILYDNMSQVRSGPGRLNARFADFAGCHGFEIKTHRPYRARTKGKVERMVDYVKDNFLNGRTFHGLEDLNSQAQAWLDTVANARLHATTQQIPQDLWRQERDQLLPLSEIKPYLLAAPVERLVGVDSFVRFERSQYSVPPEYIGQTVLVQAAEGAILIRCREAIIAEHEPAKMAGQTMALPEHLETLWQRTLEQCPLRGERHSNIHFDESVLATPLATYEEACR